MRSIMAFYISAEKTLDGLMSNRSHSDGESFKNGQRSLWGWLRPATYYCMGAVMLKYS